MVRNSWMEVGRILALNQSRKITLFPPQLMITGAIQLAGGVPPLLAKVQPLKDTTQPVMF
jgi:hypothetical protein